LEAKTYAPMIKSHYIGIAAFMLAFAALMYGGMSIVPRTAPTEAVEDFYNYLYYVLDGGGRFFILGVSIMCLQALPNHKITFILVFKYLLIYCAGYTLTRVLWCHHYRTHAGLWEIVTYVIGFSVTTFIGCKKWKNDYR